MKNKEIILTKIDAVISNLRANSNGSEQSISDIQAFERILRQYENEDIKGARHTYNFVMDTYLREMLPAECGETLGFVLNGPVKTPELESTFKQDNPKFHFSQDSNGLHAIRDTRGNEIRIDVTKLTMEDIRELLSGFGGIMQSISTHTWNKKLSNIEPSD